MANPNRALANMPKRPFDLVKEFRELGAAHDLADQLRAEGWDTKVTTRVDQKPSPSTNWRVVRRFTVWRREAKRA